MNPWIKGKPTDPGLYWFALYAGHGEFGVYLVKVFHWYPQEILDSSAYPKPNIHGGYQGPSLSALIDFEAKHPMELCYRLIDQSKHYALSSASILDSFIKVEEPALPPGL